MLQAKRIVWRRPRTPARYLLDEAGVDDHLEESMRGICIDFNPPNVGTIWPEPADPTPSVQSIPPDDTVFCFFFRPVFPYMRDLYWFAANFYSTPFGGVTYEDGGEARFDAARMDIGLDDGNYALFRPGTLPELASQIGNDWLDLIGLRCSEEEAISTARQLSAEQGDFDRYVVRNTELAFHCMDGFWWEFYPRDPALLEVVTRPLQGVPGVGIRSCDSNNQNALFDPNAI
jgi:hypothetical protein